MENNTNKLLKICLLIFGILILSIQYNDIHAVSIGLDNSKQWEDSVKRALYPDLKLDSITVNKPYNSVN